MYKNVQYRLQFWTDFNKIHIIDASLLMCEPYFFGISRSHRTTDIGSNMPPKNRFSAFIQLVWGSSKKKPKSSILYPISLRKGYTNFCRPTPFSLQDGHVRQKLFFKVILENIGFLADYVVEEW